MSAAQLVVVLGRPATGKTTLATVLAQHQRAAYLPAGTGDPLDQDAALRTARANLVLGLPVVVDTASATHADRGRWREVAAQAGATLVVFETFRPRMVPPARTAGTASYDAWDDRIDGPRTPVDMTDPREGIECALSRLLPPS